MPYDGNGVYSLPSTTVTPAVTDTTIDSSEFNDFTADLETALSLCATNDGQTVNPIFTNPIINSLILDTNGNEMLNLVSTASAVNNVVITNATTGSAAEISTSQTNTSLSLTGNGTGGVSVDGLKTKVIEIGDWDMDANASPAVAPVHGLTLSTIRSFTATIRNDFANAHYPVAFGASATAPSDVVISAAGTTSFTLSRRAGSGFDDPAFDATTYNRGWIVIQYAG